MNKFMEKLWAKKESKKGFTLVELIVVLVILAILAAITIPSMIGWINKARDKQAMLECRTYLMAAQTVATEVYTKDENAKVIDAGDVHDLAFPENDDRTSDEIKIEDGIVDTIKDFRAGDGFLYSYSKDDVPEDTTAGTSAVQAGWTKGAKY